MPIAKLTIELEIPHAHSLKDRRQVVRSMKDQLRGGFNLSIAEMDEAVAWNRATLGIVAISSSSGYLQGQMEQIDRACHRMADQFGAEIVDSSLKSFPKTPDPPPPCARRPGDGRKTARGMTP